MPKKQIEIGGFSVKKQMKLWQLTLGYVICVGIIFWLIIRMCGIKNWLKAA